MTCQYSGCNVPESECSGECIQSYKNAMVDAEMAGQKAMSQQIEIMNELLDAKSKIAELREDARISCAAIDMANRKVSEYSQRIADLEAQLAQVKERESMLCDQLGKANAQLADEKLHVKQLEKGFDKFQAQLAALQAGGEAYAYEIPLYSGNGSELVYAGWFKQQGEEPYGTPLYTHPQPTAPISAIQPGYAVVRECLEKISAFCPPDPTVDYEGGTPEMDLRLFNAEIGDTARSALAMLAAAPAIQPQAAAPAVVPEGYALVPIWPTDAQCDAAMAENRKWPLGANCIDIYRAMLSAAPNTQEKGE